MDYIKYKSGQELWASPKPCCMYLYIYYKDNHFIHEKTGQAYRSVSWEHPNLLPFISA